METRFLCQFHEDYTCLACNKHVYDWQEKVLSDDCCEQEYKELETKEEENWYCRMCTKDIFPFHEINNTQLHKILIKSGRPKNYINKDIREIKSKIKTTT